MQTYTDSCITVREVLGPERQLVAPLYQRRYSWAKKELDQFWDDLDKLAEGASDTLFLGAVILKHEGHSDPGAARLEQFLILDGQQRLITLYLLLLAATAFVTAVCLAAPSSASTISSTVTASSADLGSTSRTPRWAPCSRASDAEPSTS